MIQLNMATGELISTETGLELIDLQTSKRQTAEPLLQPCLFETPDKGIFPVDLAMVDASLFIAGQL